MRATVTTPHGSEIAFDDFDVVNPTEYASRLRHDGTPDTSWGTKAYLLHDQGFTLAVVFARCEQDAVDEAVDAGKLDRFQVSAADLADYGATEEEQSERLSYLGNASEPFDVESLGIIELPLPPFSLAALVTAAANELVETESWVDLQARRALTRDLNFQQDMVAAARRAFAEGDPTRGLACLDHATTFRFEE